MKAEEEEVDIDGLPNDPVQYPLKADDEDMSWADQEPDEDSQPWKMRVLVEDYHHFDAERGL